MSSWLCKAWVGILNIVGDVVDFTLETVKSIAAVGLEVLEGAANILGNSLSSIFSSPILLLAGIGGAFWLVTKKGEDKKTPLPPAINVISPPASMPINNGEVP